MSNDRAIELLRNARHVLAADPYGLAREIDDFLAAHDAAPEAPDAETWPCTCDEWFVQPRPGHHHPNCATVPTSQVRRTHAAIAQKAGTP